MLYSPNQPAVGLEWHKGPQLTWCQEVSSSHHHLPSSTGKFENHHFTGVNNFQVIFQALLATCFEFARGPGRERAL